MKERGHNIKYLPHVFTELGVAMLATVIKTPIAAEMSIKIMRVFVAMRHLIRDNREIFMSLDNINDRLTNYDNRLTNQETKITNHDKKN